jgi:hypothetical protein
MAALYASRPVIEAPAFKVGDRVTFEGRETIVEDVTRAESGAFMLTVSNYAGRWMVSDTHPGLVTA